MFSLLHCCITIIGCQDVWKTSFKARCAKRCWYYPFTICHHPLCFPVVFPEDGINQVLSRHLLTELGRLVHTHPHCSFKRLQIDTIISFRSAQPTPCPWTELWGLQQTPGTRTFPSGSVVCLANHRPWRELQHPGAM